MSKAGSLALSAHQLWNSHKYQKPMSQGTLTSRTDFYPVRRFKHGRHILLRAARTPFEVSRRSPRTNELKITDHHLRLVCATRTILAATRMGQAYLCV